jgi:hypothetical protein
VLSRLRSLAPKIFQTRTNPYADQPPGQIPVPPENQQRIRHWQGHESFGESPLQFTTHPTIVLASQEHLPTESTQIPVKLGFQFDENPPHQQSLALTWRNSKLAEETMPGKASSTRDINSSDTWPSSSAIIRRMGSFVYLYLRPRRP